MSLSPDRATFGEHSPPSSGESKEELDPGRVVTTCPNCAARLVESRCRLLCPRCHYYMSCSDYY
jgi:hypothetical protein